MELPEFTTCEAAIEGHHTSKKYWGSHNYPLGKCLAVRASCEESLFLSATELSALCGVPLVIMRAGLLSCNENNWWAWNKHGTFGGKTDYVLSQWLGRALTLQSLSTVVIGVATPLGVDTSLVAGAHDLCPYSLYMVAEGGCESACPIGVKDCFTETLSLYPQIIGSESSDVSKWYVSDSPGRNARIDSLKDTLRTVTLRYSTYTPAIYAQGGFHLDSWPRVSWIDFNKVSEAKEEHARARRASVASKLFRKEHCSSCELDCPSYLRRRCAGVVNADAVKEYLESYISGHTGFSPNARWNNRDIQAGLALSGKTVRLALEKHCRGRRYTVTRVYRPVHLFKDDRFLEDRWLAGKPVGWEKCGKAVATLKLDWGDYRTFDIPLDRLLKFSPECREALASHTPVSMSQELVQLYIYLSHIGSFKHSVYGQPKSLSRISALRDSSAAKGILVASGNRWDSTSYYSKYMDLNNEQAGLDLYSMLGQHKGWKANF